jgi:hypothetical protein
MATKSKDPTPEQIKERCEQIQKKWSNNQRDKRLVACPTEWKVPTILEDNMNYESGEISWEVYYNQI